MVSVRDWLSPQLLHSRLTLIQLTGPRRLFSTFHCSQPLSAARQLTFLSVRLSSTNARSLVISPVCGQHLQDGPDESLQPAAQ